MSDELRIFLAICVTILGLVAIIADRKRAQEKDRADSYEEQLAAAIRSMQQE